MVDIHSDLGANNMPPIRHFGDIIDRDVRNGFFDTTACELHVCNRIKTQLTDLVQNVGMFYSIGRLCQIASTHVELIHNIETICRREVCRVVGEAPEGVRDESLRLFELLFQLSGDHHVRANGQRSQLFEDAMEVLAMCNDRLSDLSWTHYCWDAEKGCPCCESESESQERTAVSLINVFVSSGFEVGSLSRFTAASNSLNKLLAGRLVKRVLPRAFQFGRGIIEHVDESKIAAEQVGAGLADLTYTHSLRKKKSHNGCCLTV